MATNRKRAGAFLRQMSEGTFVRRVTAVSLVLVLVLAAAAGTVWSNRDSLYVSMAHSQAKGGSYAAAVKTAEKISDEDAKRSCQYAIADTMYGAGAYGEAAELFTALGSFSDSADRKMQCDYALADELYQAGNYEEALSAFAALGSFSDSPLRQQQTIYAMAEKAKNDGDVAGAVALYLSVKDYGDSYDKAYDIAFSLTGDKNLALSMLESGGQTPEGLEKMMHIAQRRAIFPQRMVSAGACHTVVLYPDGTVKACGDNTYGQCDVDGWKDIVQIETGAYHTVGLKSDGTVVAVGRNDQGQCDVGDWKNITQIAAGDSDTYARNEEGQVVMCGYHQYESITRAVDVKTIYAGAYGAVAEAANGTFVASHKSFAPKAGSQVMGLGLNTGYLLTHGLDGTLTSTFDIGGDWENVVYFDAGSTAVVAADIDGKVRAHFFREADRVDVSQLEGVVQCTAGTSHFVFLTENGELIALGDDSYGQCDVGSMNPLIEKTEEGTLE